MGGERFLWDSDRWGKAGSSHKGKTLLGAAMTNRETSHSIRAESLSSAKRAEGRWKGGRKIDREWGSARIVTEQT